MRGIFRQMRDMNKGIEHDPIFNAMSPETWTRAMIRHQKHNKVRQFSQIINNDEHPDDQDKPKAPKEGRDFVIHHKTHRQASVPGNGLDTKSITGPSQGGINPGFTDPEL